jgi:AAA domain
MSERDFSGQFDEQVDPPHAGNGKDAGSRALHFVLFDNVENAPKTWIVDGFLGVGEMSCLYGEPGSGKSVLAEDLGLHVAGKFREWLGREIGTHGAVIYIALERPNLVKRCAIAFKIKHNVHGLPFAIVSGTHDFRDARGATSMLDTIEEVERTTGQKVVLIIIDTISRALCGGDENSPKDMGALISTMGRIHEKAPGAHVLLVHHVPHDAERMRGHGSLLGAIDTGAFVQKSTGVRTATVIKANDSDEGERVAFTLESVELGTCETASAEVPRKVFTAPVVVACPDATVSGARNGARKLNANQRRFIGILTTAAIEAPANVKGMDTVPGGVTAVDRDMLKRYLVSGGWIEAVETSAQRATISNMVNALAGKNVIGVTKQHVWVIR